MHELGPDMDLDEKLDEEKRGGKSRGKVGVSNPESGGGRPGRAGRRGNQQATTPPKRLTEYEVVE